MISPEPGDRIIVRDGAPRDPEDTPTKKGALGVVVRRGIYIGSGSGLVYECEVLIDGDGSPTTLWSNQFDEISKEVDSAKINCELVNRWIKKLNG